MTKCNNASNYRNIKTCIHSFIKKYIYDKKTINVLSNHKSRHTTTIVGSNPFWKCIISFLFINVFLRYFDTFWYNIKIACLEKSCENIRLIRTNLNCTYFKNNFTLLCHDSFSLLTKKYYLTDILMETNNIII